MDFAVGVCCGPVINSHYKADSSAKIPLVIQSPSFLSAVFITVLNVVSEASPDQIPQAASFRICEL